MAGHSRINNDGREQVIKAWMIATIQERQVNEFHDLHIDTIDPEWKRRRAWFNGGMAALRLASEVRNNLKSGLVVAIAFSLKAGQELRGVDFGSLQELEATLDWSLPSLYLFERGQEPWEGTIAQSQRLEFDFLKAPLPEANAYYLEFKPADVFEYSRTVFLIA